MWSQTVRRRSLVGLLVIGMLLGSFNPAGAFLQTLGDLLSLGANTVREVQEAIQIAGSEVRTTLNDLDGTIRGLLDELEDKFQNNLDITIDSLDNATRNKFLELESLLISVNGILQDDVRFITDQARQLLRDASVQVQRLADELKRDLADVAVIGGETGAFLIERATENAIIIGSIIFLAVGALLFVFLFLRRGPAPSGILAVLGIVLALAYVGFFAALILAPQFRGFVMTSTGIGLRQRLEQVTRQPNVFAVIPEEIIVGETESLDIWGSSLLPNDEQPRVTIADREIPFAAANDRIVLDLSDIRAAAADASASAVPLFNLNPTLNRDILLRPTAPDVIIPPAPNTIPRLEGDFVLVNRDLVDRLGLTGLLPVESIVGDLIPVSPTIFGSIPLPAGAAVLKLDYASFPDITTIVTVTVPPPPLTPPDLAVTSFTLSPGSPTTADTVTATVTIANTGQQPANNFNIRWTPAGAIEARTQNVASLAGGATQRFTFSARFPNTGTFNSLVEVDTLNRVQESNEGNNTRQTSVTVVAPPPRTASITVTFTSVLVENDADPFADGEVKFTMIVNGQTQRFPSSGDISAGDGDTLQVNRTFNLTLTEGQALNISVSGIEVDLGGFPDDDDSMGGFNVSFQSTQNWGSGSHNTRSNCPDGCFRMFYTINVSG